jgi:hypothetical protein
MSSNNTSTVVRGTSLSTLLTVLFVALKLTGVIDWSWWWVVSPIWISWGLFVVLFVLLLIAAVGYKLYKKRSK